jgi:uncharacterized protein YndB with AHSA1/START domain
MQQLSEARADSVAGTRLEIVRDFDAPRELVFDMWIDDEHIKRWLPIRGTTVTSLAMQIRNGGKWRATLSDDRGGEIGLSGEFREVVPHERLVLTHQWTGGPETLVSIRFTVLAGDRTRMHFRQTGFDSIQSRDAHEEGWSLSFAQLDDALHAVKSGAAQPLAGDEQRVLELERVFDAPRALVYRLWTEPQHAARWWGPRGSRWATARWIFASAASGGCA